MNPRLRVLYEITVWDKFHVFVRDLDSVFLSDQVYECWVKGAAYIVHWSSIQFRGTGINPALLPPPVEVEQKGLSLPSLLPICSIFHALSLCPLPSTQTASMYSGLCRGEVWSCLGNRPAINSGISADIFLHYL